MYPPAIKEKAIQLRKRGFSVKEIEKKLNIARATASLWARNIPIDSQAKKRLEMRRSISKANILKAIAARKSGFDTIKHVLDKEVTSLLNQNVRAETTNNKVACALLFWAEGGKKTSNVQFTNSDPEMVRGFFKLLRENFAVSENKFSITIHLHEYHNQTCMKNFWREVTHINIERFHKIYIKPHTGKRKKVGYKGCVDIRYYDWRIAYELKSLYNAYARFLLGA